MRGFCWQSLSFSLSDSLHHSLTTMQMCQIDTVNAPAIRTLHLNDGLRHNFRAGQSKSAIINDLDSSFSIRVCSLQNSLHATSCKKLFEICYLLRFQDSHNSNFSGHLNSHFISIENERGQQVGWQKIKLDLTKRKF